MKKIYVNKKIELPFNPQDFVMFLDREKGAIKMRSLPYHHRSVDTGTVSAFHEKNGDQHNVYCQVDVKGVGFLSAETHESKRNNIPKGYFSPDTDLSLIYESEETPWEYDVYGLLDKRMVADVAKNADRLSAAGMRTEAIAGIYAINHFIMDGKDITLKEFKESSAKVFLEEAKKQKDSAEKARWKQKAADMEKKFEPAVAVRLLRTTLRVRDLSEVEDDAVVAKEMMVEACRALNIEAAELGKEGNFEIETPTGRQKYLEYICGWFAKNLGILQRENQGHLFLHMGNLTLAGEIMDLDSIQKIFSEKVFKGDAQNRAKWLKKMRELPGFQETDSGSVVVVNTNIGQYQNIDREHGIPKSLVKDMRDICFSIRKLLKTIKASFGKGIDSRIISETMINQYIEGLSYPDWCEKAGLNKDKLIEVFRNISGKVVEKGEYYAPIVTDEEENKTTVIP